MILNQMSLKEYSMKTVEKMGEEIKKIAPEHRKEFCALITYGKLTNEFEDILNGNKEYQDVLRMAFEIECADLVEKIKRFDKERKESRKRKRKEFWDRVFNCLGRCFMW